MIVLSLSGVITSSVLIIYLLRIDIGNRLSNQLLALLFFFLTIRIGKATLYYYFDLDILAVFIGLTSFLAIGPTVYLYINTVLKGRQKLTTADYLHFFPFVITLITSFVVANDTLSFFQPHLYNAILFYYLFYLMLSFYLFLNSDIYRSDLWKIKRRFLWNVLGAASIIYLFYAFDWFIGIEVYVYGGLFYSVIVYLFILKLMLDRSIFHELGKMKTYRHIDEERNDLDSLSERIQNTFEQEEIYLDPGLTIDKLSGLIGINRHQLSEFINRTKEKSFPSYVNEFRLEYAKKELLSTDQNVSEIAYASGFNSISTFNTLFKKETGLTPTDFRKSNKNRS